MTNNNNRYNNDINCSNNSDNNDNNTRMTASVSAHQHGTVMTLISLHILNTT